MPIRNEIIPLDRFLPDERNPKRHDPENIRRLVSRIQAVGFTSPVLVDEKTGILAAGHRRRLALYWLRENSFPEPDGIEPGWGVPARVGAWTELQALQVLLGDNEDPAEIEFDNASLTALLAELQEADALAGSGYTDARLDALIAELAAGAGGSGGLLPGTDPDAIPEQVETRCQPGDLWRLGEPAGGHRLLCGDSTKAEDVGRLLGDAVPLLMVTDPPYGVDYDPTWRDGISGDFGIAEVKMRGKVENDSRADWSEAWALFSGDVAYVWHGEQQLVSMAGQLAAAGLKTRNLIVWAKPSLTFGRGHYHSQHETCWYAVRKDATASWAGDRKQTTLWEVAGMNPAGRGSAGPEDAKTSHGTQKPMECMARAIRNHEGDVYEPFCGSGTTVIAAEQNGRQCYAMEIHPPYCDVILTRWEQATGKTAELLERL